MTGYKPLISSQFYKSGIFIVFMVTSLCFLFTYKFFGFYYVEYEALFDSFYSGKLTGGMPFRSVYFLGNIGISHLYSHLYQINSNVEWVSWILYTYLFVSCFIGLYIISEVLPESFPLWLKIAVLVFIYFLVFADQNIHFIFTRVSYMATGASLLGLIYFFRGRGSISKRPLLFVFLNCWFVIGTLTRCESATAVLLQMGFFGIFFLESIKRFIVLFLFPGLFLFTLLVAIAYNLKTSKEFYKQVEPDIEAQFCERKNIIPLSNMKTILDSAKWMAAKTILWVDPRVSTPSYYRSLIRPEKFIYTDLNQWNRVWDDVSEIAIKFWYLGLMSVLLSLLLIAGLKAKPASVFLWLAFVASFWVLIGLQTYTDKVNDRSFAPLLCLFILCHLVKLFPLLKPKISVKVYPVLGIIFLLFCVHLYNLKAEANLLQSDLRAYQRDKEILSKFAAGKILAINSTYHDFLVSSNEPFHTFDFSAFKRIYITDGFNMPFLPYYRPYLEKDCHCDMAAFPSFWDYLRSVHSEVVIVSTPDRMAVLQNYMKVVHNYSLRVKEDSEIHLLRLERSDGRGQFVDLRVYSLGG